MTVVSNNNPFKRQLQAPGCLTGLWMTLANPCAAEICAGAGFDWLLIDGEHGPNTLTTVLAQLQAVAPYPVAAVVRPPVNDPVIVKQYLDLGIQNLLFPMIQNARQAEAAVASVRYPPRGVRGVGSGLARASRWGFNADYLRHADDSQCVLVQVESVEALEALDGILAVEGVDGVFIGPADLSAYMGHPGNASHPDVQAAITDGIARILRAGKAPGILSTQDDQARHWLSLGARFVAVGIDAQLLAQATRSLRQRFAA